MKRDAVKRTPAPLRVSMKRARSGVVLVAVLVALLVVMLVSATLVRGLVVQHRLARSEQQEIQAFWFAESAVQRALTQLQARAEYVGETWQVELPQLDSQVGQAVIQIESVENDPNKRNIIIKARWPKDPIDGVLQERSILVDMNEPVDAL